MIRGWRLLLPLMVLFAPPPAKTMDATPTAVATMLPGSANSPAATRVCLAGARAMVRDLLPGAERLVGRKLSVIGPDEVLVARIDGIEISQDDEVANVTFRPGDADGRISIFNRSFCRFRQEDRKVVMAHELGHVVDQAVNGDLNQPCFKPCVPPPWSERIREVRASAYAMLIFRALGDDAERVVRHYASRPQYLERINRELSRLQAPH